MSEIGITRLNRLSVTFCKIGNVNLRLNGGRSPGDNLDEGNAGCEWRTDYGIHPFNKEKDPRKLICAGSECQGSHTSYL